MTRPPNEKIAGSGTFFLVIFCCIFLPTPSTAADYEESQGPATVQIYAPKEAKGRLEVGLSGKLSISFQLEGKATLEVQPISKPTSSPDWDLLEKTDPQRVTLDDGRIRWQQTFAVTPLQPGDLTFPPAPLRFRVDSMTEDWQTVTWKPVTVRVVTSILVADLSELRDVTPPEGVPPARSWRVPIFWGGAGLLGIVLALAGLRLYRRSNHPVPLSPDQWAFRELDRVELLPLSTEAAVDQFHTELSDVVRRYLELRFQLPAPEQTTPEFLQGMGRSPELTTGQQELLRDFLQRCDLVKFARAQSSIEACRELSAKARAFLKETAAPKTPARLDTAAAPTSAGSSGR